MLGVEKLKYGGGTKDSCLTVTEVHDCSALYKGG